VKYSTDTNSGEIGKKMKLLETLNTTRSNGASASAVNHGFAGKLLGWKGYGGFDYYGKRALWWTTTYLSHVSSYVDITLYDNSNDITKSSGSPGYSMFAVRCKRN
jgi:hypothetical protein